MTRARRSAPLRRRAHHGLIALSMLALAGCANVPSASSTASIETAAADAPQAEAQALAIATARCGARPDTYAWQPGQPGLVLPAAALTRGRLISAAIEGDNGLGVLVYRCQPA